MFLASIHSLVTTDVHSLNLLSCSTSEQKAFGKYLQRCLRTPFCQVFTKMPENPFCQVFTKMPENPFCQVFTKMPENPFCQVFTDT